MITMEGKSSGEARDDGTKIKIAYNDYREAASINIEAVCAPIYSQLPLLTPFAAVQEIRQRPPRRGAMEEIRKGQ
jgi:hypothetical protein